MSVAIGLTFGKMASSGYSQAKKQLEDSLLFSRNVKMIRMLVCDAYGVRQDACRWQVANVLQTKL